MNNTAFLYDLVCRKLSLDSQEYYDERASTCFATDSGPSWFDLYIEPHAAGHGGTAWEASDSTGLKANSSDVVADDELPTFRIESMKQLQDVAPDTDAVSFMCFIRQRNSLSRLSTGKTLFSGLFQLCSFSPRALDFVLCFGLPNGETDVNPPAMFHHIQSNGCGNSDAVSQLTFECAYLLRFVEFNHRLNGIPWSVRQTGILQRTSGASDSSKWIFLGMSSQAQIQLRSYIESIADRSTVHVFTLHFVLIDTAVWGWRRYIIYLANEIRKQADRAVLAEFDAVEPGLTRLTGLEERQYIKQLEDSVIEASTILNFMVGNINSVKKFYKACKAHSYRPAGISVDNDGGSDLISDALDSRTQNLLLYQAQVDSLYQKVQGVSSLVSNILELESGNALRVLGLETRIENANMAILTKKSVEDASSVKVLTIVTLVYLPVTVVTNFFSTIFVTHTDDRKLTVIPNVWVLFVVSAPLTVITIYLWYSFARKEVHGHFPQWIETILRYVSIPRIASLETGSLEKKRCRLCSSLGCSP